MVQFAVRTEGDEMRRWIGWVVLVVVGAGAVVGLVSQSGRTDAEGAKASSKGGVAADAATHSVGAPIGADHSARSALPHDLSANPAAVGASESLGQPRAVPGAGDQVVRTATLDLRVKRNEISGGPQRIETIVGGLGGFVQKTDASREAVTMTIRVPADHYSDALRRLGGLGTVRGRTEQGDNVSGQLVDFDARIRNLAAQEAVLQGLMDDAGTVTDTITIQQQLFGVREQIEQLRGQRDLLANQATFATITVTMLPRGAVVAKAETRSPIAAAWSDAWAVSVAIVGGTIVVLGALIPLGLLALIGFGIWRVMRRTPRMVPTP